MRRTMQPADKVAVTLNGVTAEYNPSQARVSVDDTSDRGGTKHRFMTIVIPLVDGEFPEDMTQHLARIAEG